MKYKIEKEFDEAMRNIYRSADSECSYRPTYFLGMVDQHGGVLAAKKLLHSSKHSKGLTRLWKLGRLDLSMEALVLKCPWKTLFTEAELQSARKRLTELDFNFDHLHFS